MFIGLKSRSAGRPYPTAVMQSQSQSGLSYATLLTLWWSVDGDGTLGVGVKQEEEGETPCDCRSIPLQRIVFYCAKLSPLAACLLPRPATTVKVFRVRRLRRSYCSMYQHQSTLCNVLPTIRICNNRAMCQPELSVSPSTSVNRGNNRRWEFRRPRMQNTYKTSTVSTIYTTPSNTTTSIAFNVSTLFFFKRPPIHL